MSRIKARKKNKAVYCEVTNSAIDFHIHSKNILREDVEVQGTNTCFSERPTKLGFSIKHFAVTEDTFDMMIKAYLKLKGAI